MHKNKNEAKGNFNIYGISIFQRLFKVGKADADRITHSSGNPTRIHQQIRKLVAIFGENNILLTIFEKLTNVSNKEAKESESDFLQSYYEITKEVPEGNKKSFKPKKK